ncbi:hypothetical protein C5167_047060 [Papaver somniferum]|uniref:Uncharacterized protein n=1 Tax=Papaver somniferum TaxID=3469 RepID=A0A4Y7LJI3_PAPSO|nr:hypothetical protein C5167_047060 [Papaver somniferum]
MRKKRADITDIHQKECLCSYILHYGMQLLQMDQLTILDKEGIGFFPSETSLECMVKFSDYFLVAVSPGNRIKGTGVIQRNNNQKHCKITETNCPCADLVEAFIKIIEENADKIDKVDHLEIWMHSTASEQSMNYLAQAIDYFSKLGFTYEGKRLDGEAHAVTRWLPSLWDGLTGSGLWRIRVFIFIVGQVTRHIKGLHEFEEHSSLCYL